MLGRSDGRSDGRPRAAVSLPRSLPTVASLTNDETGTNLSEGTSA
jgi:hypothetical protein